MLKMLSTILEEKVPYDKGTDLFTTKAASKAQKHAQKEHDASHLLSSLQKMAEAGRKIATAPRAARSPIFSPEVTIANDHQQDDRYQTTPEVEVSAAPLKTKEQKKSQAEQAAYTKLTINRNLERTNRANASERLAIARQHPVKSENLQKNMTEKLLEDKKAAANFTERLAKEQSQTGLSR